MDHLANKDQLDLQVPVDRMADGAEKDQGVHPETQDLLVTVEPGDDRVIRDRRDPTEPPDPLARKVPEDLMETMVQLVYRVALGALVSKEQLAGQVEPALQVAREVEVYPDRLACVETPEPLRSVCLSRLTMTR